MFARGFCSVARRLNFENHAQAFADKSTWEVARTLAVLGACSFQGFVDNSLWLVETGRRYLGGSLVDGIARRTFYKQFVGGDRPEDIDHVVGRLRKNGVRPMIVCTMEEAVGQGSNEEMYDRNMQRVLGCLKLTHSFNVPSATVQLKITSIFSPDLLVRLGHLFLSDSINKHMMVETLAKTVSGEGLEFLKGLTVEDNFRTEKGLGRLRAIGQAATDRGIKILVDAECTDTNPAISLLALAMMTHFNRKAPCIWNTYQCYLKRALNDLQRDWDLATGLQVCFGVKLVRGAYIALERTRAVERKCADPVCNSYEDTNKNYNKVLGVLLEKMALDGDSRFNFVAATHNEESIRFAIDKMEHLNINSIKGGVHFAQLYGMCDQVTYPLASAGYKVYKSVPYGPLEEALPYLARRAVENRSVLEGARKEQTLLRRELLSRIGLRPTI